MYGNNGVLSIVLYDTVPLPTFSPASPRSNQEHFSAASKGTFDVLQLMSATPTGAVCCLGLATETRERLNNGARSGAGLQAEFTQEVDRGSTQEHTIEGRHG